MKITKYSVIISSLLLILLSIYTNNSIATNDNIVPTASENIVRELNKNGNRNRKSYLTPLSTGFMRVFYDTINNNIGVEYYDNNFNILKKNKIELELEVYGGFYAGSNAYYIVVGQNNTEEDDNLEVIRVIKYDTNWNRIGAAKITSNTSIYGGKVRYPFDAR